ncbi:MAG TPA: hypothetical protein VIK81_00525 [Patescibacteria group bacterium]
MTVENEKNRILVSELTKLPRFNLIDSRLKDGAARMIVNAYDRVNFYFSQSGDQNEVQWTIDAFVIPPQVKDQIAVFYLQHVIGLDEKMINNYKNTNLDKESIDKRMEAQNRLSTLHKNRELQKLDSTAFWQAISELLPGYYSDEILDQLKTAGDDGFGTFKYLLELDLCYPNSQLLTRIRQNGTLFD